MTNEEAIKFLKTWNPIHPLKQEAKEMAIGALNKSDIVHCKDCIHRGNSKKCMLAVIGKQNDIPHFFLDNSGEWYCADGKSAE